MPPEASNDLQRADGRSPLKTLVPGTRIGGYTLVRKISEGGMGEVYEGVQRVLKRRVAIKLLAGWAAGRANLRARFLREGETAARIRHHNIVEIYDIGVWEERPFIVMEYLDGKPLDELMRLDGAMPEQRIADLMLPVLSAVCAANDRGIVHRDLKPDNIFIAETDSGVEPKVLDFGISRVVTSHERLTMDAQQIGTPHYMSPEQARGESVDACSDQYSLGVVLYEMATGHLPRDHETPLNLLNMVAHQGFTPPRHHAPNMSDRLEMIILRAMGTTQADRYADLGDMMRELLPLASDPVRSYWSRELTLHAASSEDRISIRPPTAEPSEASLPALTAMPTRAPDLAVPPSPKVPAEAATLAANDDEARRELGGEVQGERADGTAEGRRSPWPWVSLVLLLALLGAGGWMWNNQSVQTGVPDPGSQTVPATAEGPTGAAGAETTALPEGELGTGSQAEPSAAEAPSDSLAQEGASAAPEPSQPPADEAALGQTASDAETSETATSPSSTPSPSVDAPRMNHGQMAERARGRRSAMEAAMNPPAAEAPSEPTMSPSMDGWRPTTSTDNIDPWN